MTDCFVSGNDTKRNTLFVDATTAHETLSTFTGAGCSSQRSAQTSRYTYTLGGPVSSPSGSWELDLAYTELELTPSTQAQASAYNSSAWCGMTNWQVGVPRSLMGRTCGGVQVPALGTPLYQVYRITGDNLELGIQTQQDDCWTPAHRCSTLGANVLHRQP